jgi:Holliday junction resolvase RusA-like endonuclease
MVFDIEVETRVTVHETAKDNESEYIKVTRKDMVRLLKQLKDEENKHIEAIEKQFSDYFGI